VYPPFVACQLLQRLPAERQPAHRGLRPGRGCLLSRRNHLLSDLNLPAWGVALPRLAPRECELLKERLAGHGGDARAWEAAPAGPKSKPPGCARPPLPLGMKMPSGAPGCLPPGPWKRAT